MMLLLLAITAELLNKTAVNAFECVSLCHYLNPCPFLKDVVIDWGTRTHTGTHFITFYTLNPEHRSMNDKPFIFKIRHLCFGISLPEANRQSKPMHVCPQTGPQAGLEFSIKLDV